MDHFNFDLAESTHHGVALILDLFVKGSLLIMVTSIAFALISFICKRKD